MSESVTLWDEWGKSDVTVMYGVVFRVLGNSITVPSSIESPGFISSVDTRVIVVRECM